MAEESDLVKNHSLLASMLNSATSSVDDEQSKKREHHSDSSAHSDAESKSTQKLKKARKEKKKGTRKNIRKIIGDDKLDAKTLQARQEEIERAKKAEERMRQFAAKLAAVPKHDAVVISSDDDDDQNQRSKPTKPSCDDSDDDLICMGEVNEPEETEDMENAGHHTDDTFNVKEPNGRVLVNIGNSDFDIYLPRQIEQVIKPHQIGGIRFLYDNVMQSIEDSKTSDGQGCVLAHAMGLGKTLQVISFVDVFLRYSGHKHVLVVVPVNTIQNWRNEFNKWSPRSPSDGQPVDPNVDYRSLDVYAIDESSRLFEQKVNTLSVWHRDGGVLLLGYETFRILVQKRKTGQITIDQTLLDPGPSLVICDEGHRIKNENAQIAKALKQIRTKRRIILTGTPLQNNLMEYWTMVDWVKPALLGTKQEFTNMFSNPITNGQAKDATHEDRRQMRYRGHVLHETLKNCVQRRSHRVLQDDLPQKLEFVILVKLTPLQIPYYRSFTQLSGVGGADEVNMNAVVAYATCAKIWNHPDNLYQAATKKEALDDFDDDLDDFDQFSDKKRKKKKETKDSESDDWIRSCGIAENYAPGDPMAGYKVPILLTILKMAASLGEKIICFSQSLGTLDLIDKFIKADPELPGWSNRIWRIDGKSNSIEREKTIRDYSACLTPAILLISTRAGCVGINVTAATRVVMFDVSWNPVHDAQAVCRIYRIGQQKQCFIYRLVADGCMERAIYERQVAKTSLSRRIVDEKDIERLSVNSNRALMIFQDQTNTPTPEPLVDTGDQVIETVTQKFGHMLTQKPLKMEALMVETKQKLTKGEKRRAEREYKEEKNSGLSNGRQGGGRAIMQRASYFAQPTNFSHTRQPINPGLLSCQKPYLNPVTAGNAFSSSLSNSQMNLFPLNNRPNQNATPSLGDSGLTLSILNNQIENNFMSCFPTSTAPTTTTTSNNELLGVSQAPPPPLPRDFLNNSFNHTSINSGFFPSSCLPVAETNCPSSNFNPPVRLHDQQTQQQVISIDSE